MIIGGFIYEPKAKKVLFSSIRIVTALLITLGITYAVFTYSKKGSTQNTSVTSDVTTLNAMFKDCSSIESIDMSKVNLSKVDNFESTFENCSALSDVNFGNTRTSELTSIANLASGAQSLCHFDLGKFTIGPNTNINGFPLDCDNRNFLFKGDVDFMVLINLGCSDSAGSGSGYYDPSYDGGRCRGSCSLNYESKFVKQCPSYTSKEGNTCIRTSDWYKQFEP